MKSKAYLGVFVTLLSLLFIFVSAPLKLFDFISSSISLWCMQYIQQHLGIYLLLLLFLIVTMIGILILRYSAYLDESDCDLDTLINETKECREQIDKLTNKIRFSLIEEKYNLKLESSKIQWEVKKNKLMLETKKENIRFHFNKAGYVSSLLDLEFTDFVDKKFHDSDLQEASKTLKTTIRKISRL